MGNKVMKNNADQTKQEYGIGLVGYGGIGKIHTVNWRNLHLYYSDLPLNLILRGAAARTEKSAEQAVLEGGFTSGTTDYRDLIDDAEIDLIDICTPNDLHYPVFMAALEAGKDIYCEKPLALNLEQAGEMHRKANASNSTVQLAFCFRFIPAIIRAKKLIEDGFLGDVINFRAQYFHSSYLDPDKPMSWRLSREASGGGALVDLGAHVIDLMLSLLGPFSRVMAQTKTFISERPGKNKDKKIEVKVDDHAQLLIELASGGIGIIEVSRVAQGTTEDLNFEIHGSQGAIKFDVMDPSWLYAYDGRESRKPLGGTHGYKQIQTMHNYPSNRIPGGRNMVNFMGMHADSQYQMIRAAAGLQLPSPNTKDGYKVQQILDASYQSAREDNWIEILTDNP
jgi:predicted dehydrogenase